MVFDLMIEFLLELLNEERQEKKRLEENKRELEGQYHMQKELMSHIQYHLIKKRDSDRIRNVRCDQLPEDEDFIDGHIPLSEEESPDSIG